MTDQEKRIAEINQKIKELKNEKKLLTPKRNRFDDLKDYFAEKLGVQKAEGKDIRMLYGKRHLAWDNLRRLATLSVCGDDSKYVKDLTIDEWMISREMLKKLIDFYVENASDP